MARARETLDLPGTLEAFDAWHAKQPERWEFIFGDPIMMAPGSMAHTLIKTNIAGELRARLRGTNCRSLSDGAEIRTENFVAIPDIVVACGPLDFTTPSVTEPKVIVEVLSPSTASFDRHEKWRAYCRVESLAHYLLVEQDERFVTLHTRTGRFTWDERVILDGEVPLDAIGAALPLDEVYAGVTFEDEGVAEAPSEGAA